MNWIDTHVHLFGKTDEGTPPFAPLGCNNTVDVYRQQLSKTLPKAVVSVDFSRAPEAAHVVHSLAELAQAAIPAKGIIRGNAEDERTFEWLSRDDIAGIRMYAVANCPDLQKNASAYHRMFNMLRHKNQHICIYGAGAFLHGLIEQLPEDITLLIDHLAMGNASKGLNDNDFQKTLALLEARKNRGQHIYFKGPGYRSTGTLKQIAEHVCALINRFGAEQLLLGASDAPFLGFTDAFDYEKVLAFTESLTQTVAQMLDQDVAALREAVLYENAKQLYGF